jgi:hypothetical protein
MCRIDLPAQNLNASWARRGFEGDDRLALQLKLATGPLIGIDDSCAKLEHKKKAILTAM